MTPSYSIPWSGRQALQGKDEYKTKYRRFDLRE
jgi:hypothetical protein